MHPILRALHSFIYIRCQFRSLVITNIMRRPFLGLNVLDLIKIGYGIPFVIAHLHLNITLIKKGYWVTKLTNPSASKNIWPP